MHYKAFTHTASYLWLLPLALAAGGCKKSWLDAKTDKNLAVPSTLNDFQTLLDNADEMNANSCGIGEVASDDHLVQPDYWPYESYQEHNAYTWTHDQPVINSPDWNAGYRRVAVCNQVLEGLGRITPVNTSDRQWRDELKGTALFQRGRSFFELAQVFAPDYNSVVPAGHWGIPLRLGTDINEPSVRATVSETYAQVLADLTGAKELLPLAVTYKTRPSRAAGLAMLARVYLAMGRYDSANVYADGCLRLYNRLLDYTVIDTAAHPFALFNPEVIFHATLVKWGNITVDAITASDLYALYDSSDRRRALFFNCSSPQAIRFRGSYAGDYGDGNFLFSGLAVDEQYLIRAECRARLGATDSALADIQTLLGSRYVNHLYVPTAVTAAEALSLVLRERRKELFLRGLRWTDLRRLNHDRQYAVNLTRTIGGHTYQLDSNNYRYAFPIPDDIIQLSGIAQNPGW